MTIFVIDASATLPWCFEDEATAWSDALLERLRAGDRVIVPAHWPTEVSNGLLMAVRRKRILPGRAEMFWDQLARLPIEVESPLAALQAKEVLALSQLHGLTVYDATYLELSRRRQLALATLDEALKQAASIEGVSILL